MNIAKYNEEGLLDRWNSLRWFQKTISIGLVSGYILGLTYIWVMHVSFDIALLTIVLWSGGIISFVVGMWLSIFTWKHLIEIFIIGLTSLVLMCLFGRGFDNVVDTPLFIMLCFGVSFCLYVCTGLFLSWVSSQKKIEIPRPKVVRCEHADLDEEGICDYIGERCQFKNIRNCKNFVEDHGT